MPQPHPDDANNGENSSLDPTEELFLMKVVTSRMDPQDRNSQRNVSALNAAYHRQQVQDDLDELRHNSSSRFNDSFRSQDSTRRHGHCTRLHDSFSSQETSTRYSRRDRIEDGCPSRRNSYQARRGSLSRSNTGDSRGSRGSFTSTGDSSRRSSLRRTGTGDSSRGSSRRSSLRRCGTGDSLGSFSSEPGPSRRNSTRGENLSGHAGVQVPLNDTIEEVSASEPEPEDFVIRKILEHSGAVTGRGTVPVSGRRPQTEYVPRAPHQAHNAPTQLPYATITNSPYAAPPQHRPAYDDNPPPPTPADLAQYSDANLHGIHDLDQKLECNFHNRREMRDIAPPHPNENHLDGDTHQQPYDPEEGFHRLVETEQDLTQKMEQTRRALLESQASTPGAYASSPLAEDSSDDTQEVPERRNSAQMSRRNSAQSSRRNSNPGLASTASGSTILSAISSNSQGLPTTSQSTLRSMASSVDLSRDTSGMSTTDIMDGGQQEGSPINPTTSLSGEKAVNQARNVLTNVLVGLLLVAVVLGAIIGLVVLPNAGDDEPAHLTNAASSLDDSLRRFQESLLDATHESLLDRTSSQSICAEFVTSTPIQNQTFPNLPLWKQQQRFALAVLYYELHSQVPPSDKDECKWFSTGGACSIPMGYYENLELELPEDTTMTGMPLEVGLLTNLLELTITGVSKTNSSLSDWLPEPVVHSTPLLQTLHLTSLQFSGSIPSYLSQWTSLQSVDFVDLKLTGIISGAALSGWTQLQALHMDQNQLTGSIPTQIGLLSKLVYIDLRANQLMGSIPSEIEHMDKLREVRFSHNQLSGDIPSELGVLADDLLVFFVEGNKNLTGRIPAEICNLVNVDVTADCQTVICCGAQAQNLGLCTGC